MLIEETHGTPKRGVLILADADIDQFQKPPRPQRWYGKMGKQLGKGLDIGHGGDTALGQQLKAFGNRVDVILRSERTPQRVDVLDPLGETLLGRNRPLETGIIKMAMSVDQT